MSISRTGFPAVVINSNVNNAINMTMIRGCHINNYTNTNVIIYINEYVALIKVDIKVTEYQQYTIY